MPFPRGLAGPRRRSQGEYTGHKLKVQIVLTLQHQPVPLDEIPVPSVWYGPGLYRVCVAEIEVYKESKKGLKAPIGKRTRHAISFEEAAKVA